MILTKAISIAHCFIIGYTGIIELLEVPYPTTQANAGRLPLHLCMWSPTSIYQCHLRGSNGILGELRHTTFISLLQPVRRLPLSLRLAALWHDPSNGTGELPPSWSRFEVGDTGKAALTGQKAFPGLPDAHAKGCNGTEACHYHASHCLAMLSVCICGVR
jgi:hypothetical protein